MINLRNSLLPLQSTLSRETPLVCVPGAGASVTTFIDLSSHLGTRWPIYGLEPCGLNPPEDPHDTVEAAAVHNLAALLQLNDHGGIHLLGHSHGGLVAFEMARRLVDEGQPVTSLTLLDTDPPGPKNSTVTPQQIHEEFVHVFENVHAKQFSIDNSIIDSECQLAFLPALHEALVRHHCWRPRTTSEMLRGPLATYTAARRSHYIPDTPYAGRIHLVLAQESCINDTADMPSRSEHCIEQWKHYAQEVAVWYAPGNHFSMLQPPHVATVADWWQVAH